MHLLNSHNVKMGTAMLHHAAEFRQTQSADGRLCNFCRVHWEWGGCHSLSVSQCVWIRVVRRSGGSGMFGVCGHRSMCMRQWRLSHTALKAFIQVRPQSSGSVQKIRNLISLKRILNWDDLWFEDVSLPKKAGEALHLAALLIQTTEERFWFHLDTGQSF